MADYGDYVAYFNGEWVPYKEVRISPDDRGFMVADVVFDIGALLTAYRSFWTGISAGYIAH